MEADFYDQLIAEFRIGNTGLMITTAIAFVLGYLEYVYSFALMRREHRAPYPVWMHTFYFAHDSSWAVIMFFAAERHDWNWFLLAVSIALMVWNLFEAYNIYMAIAVERQEIWGQYYAGTVTVQQATINVAFQLAAFFVLVNILIGWMGEGSIMQWFLFTNMLMAAGPAVVWMRRGAQENTRRGASMGLAIVILLATIHTFHPWSMWVLSVPEVFDEPWYYMAGVVFTAIAAWNLYNLAKLPPKVPGPGMERPVW